jgi:hypothetical protein
MIRRLLLFAIMISSMNLFAEIKNGYEGGLQGYKDSLRELKLMLCENKRLSIHQIHRIKSDIKNLISSISYYELTNKLIDQLKVVAPDIYNEIDSIKDKKGRSTNVFVRLIPRDHARIQLIAATFFAQSRTDKDACVSEYGKYSVSIDIWLSETALVLLCHELGHIKYAVPNLANYCDFYKRNYRNQMDHLTFIGHRRNDLSGKSAVAFEKKFFKDKESFLKQEGVKPESAIEMMQKIRKKNKNLETEPSSPFIEHGAQAGSGSVRELYISKACSTFSNFELILKTYEKSFDRLE